MATEPINWPTSPSDGDTYTSPNGDKWIYRTDAWSSVGTTEVGFGATASTQCINTTGNQSSNNVNNQWYYGNAKQGWADGPSEWSDSNLGSTSAVPVGSLVVNYASTQTFNATKIPVAYHDWNGTTSRDFLRICIIGYLDTGSEETPPQDWKLYGATLGTTCADMTLASGKTQGNLRYCEDTDGTPFNTNGTVCYYYDCPLDNFLTPAVEPFNVTWSTDKPFNNLLFGAWKIKYNGEALPPETFGDFRWSFRIDYISAKGGSPA